MAASLRHRRQVNEQLEFERNIMGGNTTVSGILSPTRSPQKKNNNLFVDKFGRPQTPKINLLKIDKGKI